MEVANLNTEIDYKELLRNALEQMSGYAHALPEYENEYLINLINTAKDYLFYLEDTSRIMKKGVING